MRSRGWQPGRVGCSRGQRTASTKTCQMALWYSSRWHAQGSSPTC